MHRPPGRNCPNFINPRWCHHQNTHNYINNGCERHGCVPAPSDALAPTPLSTETAMETSTRVFASGATRDTETGKLDYEGFLSPLVLERYAKYMHQHRKQRDGSLRDSDNWQKGIPLPAYMKSLVRHTIDAWKAHRDYNTAFLSQMLVSRALLEDLLCAIIFNASGYLFELLRGRKA